MREEGLEGRKKVIFADYKDVFRAILNMSIVSLYVSLRGGKFRVVGPWREKENWLYDATLCFRSGGSTVFVDERKFPVAVHVCLRSDRFLGLESDSET